jgi:hypothetical protein
MALAAALKETLSLSKGGVCYNCKNSGHFAKECQKGTKANAPPIGPFSQGQKPPGICLVANVAVIGLMNVTHKPMWKGDHYRGSRKTLHGAALAPSNSRGTYHVPEKNSWVTTPGSAGLDLNPSPQMGAQTIPTGVYGPLPKGTIGLILAEVV